MGAKVDTDGDPYSSTCLVFQKTTYYCLLLRFVSMCIVCVVVSGVCVHLSRRLGGGGGEQMLIAPFATAISTPVDTVNN